jgi:ABC-type transport system involved in cytochrome c biogenesis ATPase subunit/GNAT superfamily N-acetyltransferase
MRTTGTVVKIRDVKNTLTRSLELDNADVLTVNRYESVRVTDVLDYEPGRIWVRTRNGSVTVSPTYNRPARLQIGSRVWNLRIKQITNAEEQDAYEQLARYHYRGHRVAGAKVPLIVVIEKPFTVLGYVELGQSLFFNSVRDRAWNAPFECGAISWPKWGNDERASGLQNVSVRLSRVVVHPEYRGLGLAGVLFEHAHRFAADHWAVAGYKPLFVEAIADMFSFVPFAARNMTFAGISKGNLDDLIDNVRHTDRIPTGTSKRSGFDAEYRTGFLDLCESGKYDVGDLQMRLLQMRDHGLDPENYVLFHKLLKMPKPVYMSALHPVADEFLRERLAGIEPPESITAPPPGTAADGSITVSNVSVRTAGTIASTPRSIRIQEAFGISLEHFSSELCHDVSFSLEAGEILLLYGASGSGKSLLLGELMRRSRLDAVATVASEYAPLIVSPAGIAATGEIDFGNNVLGTFSPLPSGRPLIECLGASVEEAVRALNVAGLAEATVYVKSFDQLSTGQRYRAMLARLIAECKQVWLADEFLAVLDGITARLVAHNIRRQIKRSGAILIAAASHVEHYIDVLKPDKILHLTVGLGTHRLMEYDEFAELIRIQGGVAA